MKKSERYNIEQFRELRDAGRIPVGKGALTVADIALIRETVSTLATEPSIAGQPGGRPASYCPDDHYPRDGKNHEKHSNPHPPKDWEWWK